MGPLPLHLTTSKHKIKIAKPNKDSTEEQPVKTMEEAGADTLTQLDKQCPTMDPKLKRTIPTQIFSGIPMANLPKNEADHNHETLTELGRGPDQSDHTLVYHLTSATAVVKLLITPGIHAQLFSRYATTAVRPATSEKFANNLKANHKPKGPALKTTKHILGSLHLNGHPDCSQQCTHPTQTLIRTTPHYSMKITHRQHLQHKETRTIKGLLALLQSKETSMKPQSLAAHPLQHLAP